LLEYGQSISFFVIKGEFSIPLEFHPARLSFHNIDRIDNIEPYKVDALGHFSQRLCLVVGKSNATYVSAGCFRRKISGIRLIERLVR